MACQCRAILHRCSVPRSTGRAHASVSHSHLPRRLTAPKALKELLPPITMELWWKGPMWVLVHGLGGEGGAFGDRSSRRLGEPLRVLAGAVHWDVNGTYVNGEWSMMEDDGWPTVIADDSASRAHRAVLSPHTTSFGVWCNVPHQPSWNIRRPPPALDTGCTTRYPTSLYATPPPPLPQLVHPCTWNSGAP